MTHEQFMAVMTKQTYIWRMARSNDRPWSPQLVAKAEAAISAAVVERAKTIEQENVA